MRRLAAAALLFLAISLPVHAQQKIEFTIEGGKHDLKYVPVCVPLSVPKAAVAKERDRTLLTDIKRPEREQLGQFTAPGITTESIPPSGDRLVRRDLHFILPELKAGEKRTFVCSFESELGAALRWKGDDKLVWTNRKESVPPIVLKYMHAPYDNSAPEQRNRTYKVFHHLYDPAGKAPVTNGGQTDAYTDEKKLLYPHHRGLMFAFNKISYGEGLKQKADTWHAMPGDTHQEHEKVLRQEEGTVLGRHRVLVRWHGPMNEIFVTEERELTVYNVPSGTLVEFATKLKTAGGKVKLDGDPQHAGFQFRAANAVAEKTAKQTYYLRPDGKGELGATRNWEPKKGGPVDLPWDAMSFVLGDKRYTVAYLNNPKNPKESRFSERDYGRFGCYFESELTEDHPLVVNYRIWLQDGEMQGEQVEALYRAFAEPPLVTIAK